MIVAKTLSVAKDGGVWTDFLEVLAEWQAAGFLHFAPKGEPRQDGQTRTLACRILGRYGQVVTVFLRSLEHPHEAEAKFKGLRMSAVHLVEASNWNSRKVFEAAKEMLRVRGLPHDQHLLILDSNPAPEATQHWIYQIFYRERTMEDFPETCVSEQDKKDFRAFQKELSLHEIFLTDNSFLTDQEKSSLIAGYRHSVDLYNRYVLGLWTPATDDGFFSDVFIDEVHIVGNCTNLDMDKWEVLLPPENTTELFQGFDFGDRNSVCVFAGKQRDPYGKNYWSIIDEVCINDQAVKLEDLVESVVQIMDKWERFLGRTLVWRQWSDNSSFNYKLAASATEHIAIRNISRYRINLQAASKYAGAALDAIDLMRRLFLEGRLHVSASCPQMIECFKSIRPNISNLNGTRSVPNSIWKHKLDAWRYLLCSEEPFDMLHIPSPKSGRVRARIVSMA